jgi:hypothetical protein
MAAVVEDAPSVAQLDAAAVYSEPQEHSGDLPTAPKAAPQRPIRLMLFGLFVYAVLVYGYMTARFAGQWTENDTNVLSTAIVAAERANSIQQAEFQYGNGMAYVGFTLILSKVTGLPLEMLQNYLLPLLMAFGVGVVFVSYRELLSKMTVVALFATFFVFIQPDFIWVTWRGSHEKFTWLMVFLMLFALTRTFTATGKMTLSVPYMLVFYLSAFALITSNVFFASSFVVAMLLSFVGAVLILQVRQRLLHQTSVSEGVPIHIRRLIYITLICVVLLYVFAFFIYPSALFTIDVLDTFSGRLSVVLLNVEQTGGDFVHRTQAFNPYTYVQQAWLAPWIFVALTSFNWLVLGVSFIVWLVNIPDLIRKARLGERDLPKAFLWLLYPAFAAQLALSLLADRADTLGGNLQVRLFTPMMLIAIPLTAIGVHALLTRAKGRFRLPVRAGVCVALVFFAAASVLKATNEPLLNNNWLFINQREQSAVNWTVRHTAYNSFTDNSDGRLRIFAEYTNIDIFYNTEFIRKYGAALRYTIQSDLQTLREQRLGQPHSTLVEQNRIYDNGGAQVFMMPAMTRFQS